MSGLPSSPTPRRDFIAQVASAAAAVVGATACAAPLAAAMAPSWRATPTFDDSWTKRVGAAKHRAVFDSPDVNAGAVFEQALVYMQNYREMFGSGDGEAVPVIVLRHMGTMMAMGDALWDKYELGKRAKLKDPSTGADTKRNLFLHAAAGDDHETDSADSTLAALQARGAVVLACNRALMFFGAEQAKLRNTDVEEVRAELRSGLAPGVILQPSGIYATLRAQEVGCGFFKSS
jgi:intracellular sulfur oxidation DsrE/DsrF family protein